VSEDPPCGKTERCTQKGAQTESPSKKEGVGNHKKAPLERLYKGPLLKEDMGFYTERGPLGKKNPCGPTQKGTFSMRPGTLKA